MEGQHSSEGLLSRPLVPPSLPRTSLVNFMCPPICSCNIFLMLIFPVPISTFYFTVASYRSCIHFPSGPMVMHLYLTNSILSWPLWSLGWIERFLLLIVIKSSIPDKFRVRVDHNSICWEKVCSELDCIRARQRCAINTRAQIEPHPLKWACFVIQCSDAVNQWPRA